MGQIYVIEGLDGCGKSSQLNMLKNQLNGYRFLSFPNYSSPSGTIIKQYLSGEIQEKDSVAAAYSASTFYAVDRYISYKSDWERDILSGTNIISARYTTSNAIYQMTKLDKSLWKNYCDWLYDFEYVKLGIPKPNKVIYLSMPVEISQQLLSKRYDGSEEKKDIHESNVEYLKLCRDAVGYVMCNTAGEEWRTVECCKNGSLRTPEEIHEEIKEIILG